MKKQKNNNNNNNKKKEHKEEECEPGTFLLQVCGNEQIHGFSPGGSAGLDQKCARGKEKIFPMTLHTRCGSDRPWTRTRTRTRTRTGHLGAARWLADMSGIKAARVSPLIDCGAFFSPPPLFTISAFLLKCVPSYWLGSCTHGDVWKSFDSAE